MTIVPRWERRTFGERRRRAQPSGTWLTLAGRAEVTRLGEGLEETGRHPSGRGRRRELVARLTCYVDARSAFCDQKGDERVAES
jgi:hypothetical protein